MTDITEFPVWTDSPAAKLIPPDYVLRKGPGVIVLEWQSGVLHVDVGENDVDEHLIKIMVDNLGHARFEREFPGEFMKMVRREAEWSASGQIGDKPDLIAWTVFNRYVGKTAESTLN